jgi:membrane protease YdiL (CAAX protease family)
MQEKIAGSPTQEQTTTPMIANPIFVATVFFLISFFFRIVDIFILQMNQTDFGILPSKVIPLILLIIYLRYIGRNVSVLGIHSNLFMTNLLLAVLSVSVFNGILTGGPYLVLLLLGDQPHVSFYKLDYIVYDLIFQTANAFMEEMLFRGLLLRCFMTRTTPVKSNILQALLFGLWHIVWPLDSFLGGYMTAGEALVWALEYILESAIIGFLWGTIYLRSSSLVTPILFHFSTNFISSYITVEGSTVSMGLITIVMGVLAMIVTYIIALQYMKRKAMPRLAPWDKNLLFGQVAGGRILKEVTT